MKKSFSLFRAALALGLACALPAVAHAQAIYDEIVVDDASGNLLASVTATPDDIAANPYSFFYVPGIAVDPNEYGNYDIVTDSDGNALYFVGVAVGGPDALDLAFAGPTLAPYIPYQNPVVGTGQPIDISVDLDPSLQSVGDTAYFIAENSVVVPEPLTWAMMLIGFAAVGCGLRRKARARPAALAWAR